MLRWLLTTFIAVMVLTRAWLGSRSSASDGCRAT
ncbi:Uncharacterised protein [Burkholderia pseudomallei]|nr:Uncharacterised protein [Burkholderia pseudomallei]